MLPKRNQGQAHCLGHLWHLCDSNALGAQAWALCLAGHSYSPLPIALFVCFSSPQFFAPLRSPSPKPQGPAGSLRSSGIGTPNSDFFPAAVSFFCKTDSNRVRLMSRFRRYSYARRDESVVWTEKKPGKQPGNDKLVPKKNSFGVENVMPFSAKSKDRLQSRQRPEQHAAVPIFQGPWQYPNRDEV